MKLEAKTVGIGGVAALLFGMGVLYFNSGKSPEGPKKDQVSQAEIDLKRKIATDRAKLENEEACKVLAGTQENLSSIAKNRKKILEGYSVLLSCKKDLSSLSLEEFNDKYAELCRQITFGLETSLPKWRHPILNDFYMDLHEKLCNKKVEAEIDSKPGLKNLKELKDNVKKLKLLSPETPKKEVCYVAVELIKNDSEKLLTVLNYILKNESRVKPGGELQKLLTRLKAAAAKNSLSVPEYSVKRVGTVQNWGNIGCSFTYAQGLVEDLKPVAEAAVIELIELISDDTSNEGKEVTKIMLTLGNQMFK